MKKMLSKKKQKIIISSIKEAIQKVVDKNCFHFIENHPDEWGWEERRQYDDIADIEIAIVDSLEELFKK